MTCTWEHADGRTCGKPAEVYRVKWSAKGGRQEGRWFLCARHHRALAPDSEARTHGIETYDVSVVA